MDANDDRLRAVLVGRLESLERAGVMQLPKPARQAATILAATLTAAPAPPVIEERSPVMEENPMAKSSVGKTAATPAAPVLFDEGIEQPKAPAAASLAVLRQEVAACTQCTELASLRANTVFGVGNPKARLCFMGEAPGADEDRTGEPFVGRAGQLLTKIIEACKLKREDVYILNMIKCRPPGNRNPLPNELANCRGFLERQLDLIQPEFICCLGAVASQNLLNSQVPISKLRGKLHAYRGIKVVCTFHPAYLLRNPAAKKDAWDDMKFLFREMGVEL
jgi:uracil-DNA glycosylase